MLAKAGRDEGCSNAASIGRSAKPRRRALARSGRTPNALHNNCSGKHAGFVCLPCAMGVEPRGDVAPDHPVQREVAAAIAAATGRGLSEETRGVDGCAIPTYAVPLIALARGFARFGDRAKGSSPARAERRGAHSGGRRRPSGDGRRKGPFRHRGHEPARRPRLHQGGRRGRILRRAARRPGWASRSRPTTAPARGAGHDRVAHPPLRRFRRRDGGAPSALRRSAARELERRRSRAPASGGPVGMTVPRIETVHAPNLNTSAAACGCGR